MKQRYVGFIRQKLLAHLMKLPKGLLSFFLVGLLVSSTAGCLALVPARELLEGFRGAPQDIPMKEIYEVVHTFTDPIQSIEPISEQQSFTIDSETEKLSIYLRVSMTDPPGYDTSQWTASARYVEVTLKDSTGNNVWSEKRIDDNKTTTEYLYTEDFENYELGVWTLDVEARGYGINLAGFEFYDDFTVRATAEKTCVKYTQLDCIQE